MSTLTILKKTSIWFLLLTCFGLQAQTSGLTGKVLLSDNQTPVPNLYIYLVDTGLDAITDAAGVFSIKDVPAGQYRLVVSGLGFSTVEKAVDLSEDERLELDLRVSETVIGLPEVMVEGVSLTGGMRGLRSIPGAAHYISPKELQKFSATDVNRVLRAAPGVNMQEEDGFGLRPNIGLRGTGSERSSKITIMEDGVLAAPAPYSAPAAYYFPTVGRMQGVEILKGSSQIRFGPFTTGGAINFISTPIPEEFSGRVHLMGGSYGNRNLHVYAGNSHRNFGYVVESFQFQSDGFKQLPGDDPTGFDKKDYLAKFRINTGPNAKVYQSLTFKIAQSNEASNETYLGISDGDFVSDPFQRYAASQKDLMRTEHRQYSLRHVVQFSQNVDLVTTLYQNDFHRNWYKLDKVTMEDGHSVSLAGLLDQPAQYPEAFALLKGASSTHNNPLQVKANNRTYLSQGVQTALGFRFETNEIEHTLDFGLRYHYDEIDRFQWVDDYRFLDGEMALTHAGEPGTESNRIESAHAFAAFLQYKLKMGNWTMIPGLRHENILMERLDYGKNDPGRTGADLASRENRTDVFIPGLGVHYELNDFMNIFGGVHQGFSPPGSNEGSRPEKSTNYEVGFRYQKARLNGQAVVFYSDYDNLLGADLAAVGGGGSTHLFNGGAAVARGLEFQLTYDLLNTQQSNLRLPLTVVYTHTDATFRGTFDSEFEGWGQVEEGDELPYLARNQLAVLLGLSGVKFDVNLSARYQDAMRTVAGQGPIPEAQGTDAYFIVDMSANYQLHPNLSLFASVTNLTDQSYIVARRPAGVRPGLPRAFMAGLKADF